MVGGLAAVMVNGSAVQNCGQMSHKRVTKVCFRSVYKALRSVPWATLASNAGQFTHDPVEAGLSLEADAWAVGQRNRAPFDSGIVGKSTEIAKDTGIGFGASEPKTCGDGE
jgi:hypothetical protein